MPRSTRKQQMPIYDKVQERRARGAVSALAEEGMAGGREEDWSICRDARMKFYGG